MSGGSRDDVGRFTVSCTSIQFLCLIFLVSCPIFVDKCSSGFRVQGSGFRVQGSGFRVVVAASPRIYMGRCLKTAFKLQVTSHQSLASLLYFSAAPVEPFPNQKSEAGRILLPIFSNLIYFQRTLCTRGRSRRHLPWRGDHTAHAWRAWRCRSLPLLRPSPPS